jgi:microcystin-dependent protein
MTEKTINFIKLPDGNTYKIGGGLDDKITNCITEIPQDIKLELNDGTLTLKAGSKVYVPNGFEADGTTPKFDYVTIESDIVEDTTTSTTAGTTRFLAYNRDVNELVFQVYSATGTNNPYADKGYGCLVYRTDVNKVSYYMGSNITVENCSFPIGLVVSSSTAGASSIDQVFNGFGYIGSTVFVLPNVKGLIPNGRNEDGSLNNVEFTTSSIKTRSHSGGTYESFFGIGDGKNITWTPKSAYSYNESDNRTLTNGADWRACVCGELGSTNGQITSFTPKLPFRAVDYNDLTSVVPTGTVISSASSATPTGYLYCNGAAVSRTTYADLFSAIGTTYGTGDGSTTFNLPNYSNYNFVTSNSVAVKGTGKALGLTNGTNYYGMQASNSNGLYPSGNGYGVNVGTSGMTPQNLGSIAMGVTTDASKSGLNGTVSTAKINWYIKY